MIAIAYEGELDVVEAQQTVHHDLRKLVDNEPNLSNATAQETADYVLRKIVTDRVPVGLKEVGGDVFGSDNSHASPLVMFSSQRYGRLVAQVLEERVLSPYDLIDMITIHPLRTSPSPYATALSIVLRCKVAVQPALLLQLTH